MTTRTRTSVLSLGLLAALGLGASSAALADSYDDGVSWSVGVAAPGVTVRISTPAPVAYVPPRVIYAPPPVVYEPAPRVVYAPAPVVYPQPVYHVVYPGGHEYKHKHHHRHHHHGRHDGWAERHGGHDDRAAPQGYYRDGGRAAPPAYYAPQAYYGGGRPAPHLSRY